MTESCREAQPPVNYVRVAGTAGTFQNLTAVQIIGNGTGADQLQLFQTTGSDPSQRQIYAIIDPNSATGQQLAMLTASNTAVAVPLAGTIDNSLIQVNNGITDPLSATVNSQLFTRLCTICNSLCGISTSRLTFVSTWSDMAELYLDSFNLRSRSMLIIFYLFCQLFSTCPYFIERQHFPIQPNVHCWCNVWHVLYDAILSYIIQIQKCPPKIHLKSIVAFLDFKAVCQLLMSTLQIVMSSHGARISPILPHSRTKLCSEYDAVQCVSCSKQGTIMCEITAFSVTSYCTSWSMNKPIIFVLASVVCHLVLTYCLCFIFCLNPCCGSPLSFPKCIIKSQNSCYPECVCPRV